MLGELYSSLNEGSTLPFEATYRFVLTLGLMVAVILVAARLYPKAQPARAGSRLPVQTKRQERGIT
jgi:hypothetical protein